MSNARLTILQARAVKDRRVTDAQFRTLAALGMYADEDGWCFPALGTLGKDLSKSKQAVGRDTIALRKLGYLEVKARFLPNGSRRSNMYRLKYDLPPVNTGDGIPSTSYVDTPSTSEVDVNDLLNDSINSVEVRYDMSRQSTLEYVQTTAKEDRKDRSVESYLAMSQYPGAKKQARVDAILSYLGQTFHINTETKRWINFAKYVDDRQQQGEKVDVFVKWLLSQKDFNIQYWSPDRMREFWPAAFTATSLAPRSKQPTLEREL